MGACTARYGRVVGLAAGFGLGLGCRHRWVSYSSHCERRELDSVTVRWSWINICHLLSIDGTV